MRFPPFPPVLATLRYRCRMVGAVCHHRSLQTHTGPGGCHYSIGASVPEGTGNAPRVSARWASGFPQDRSRKPNEGRCLPRRVQSARPRGGAGAGRGFWPRAYGRGSRVSGFPVRQPTRLTVFHHHVRRMQLCRRLHNRYQIVNASVQPIDIQEPAFCPTVGGSSNPPSAPGHFSGINPRGLNRSTSSRMTPIVTSRICAAPSCRWVFNQDPSGIPAVIAVISHSPIGSTMIHSQ